LQMDSGGDGLVFVFYTHRQEGDQLRN